MKKTGIGIVCINNDGFDGLRRPRHILMEKLAQRGCRIMFASTPVSYFSERLKKEKLKWGGIAKIKENLVWYQPPVLLRRFSNPMLDFFSTILRVMVMRILVFFYFPDKPIFFVTVPCPDVEKIISYYPKSLLIYNVHDRYLDKNDKWISGHAELLKAADVVLVGSNFLFEELAADANGKIFLFPPALDFDLFKFEEPLFNAKSRCGDNKTIVGCVGNFGSQIDWELINDLTDLMEFEFVFVGPVGRAAKMDSFYSLLENKGNVKFVGEVPHNSIPAYIQSFDICILPYRLNEYSKGINPLKLLEYLACGKVVISSPVHFVRQFEGLVHVASTLSEWEFWLCEALKKDNHNVALKKYQFVKTQSYDARVDFLLEFVK